MDRASTPCGDNPAPPQMVQALWGPINFQTPLCQSFWEYVPVTIWIVSHSGTFQQVTMGKR
jgi:hypothetical protein